MDPARIERAQQLARNWVETGHTTALQVVVARRGVVVIDEAFGQVTPDVPSTMLQRDSLFAIASVTKPITATLVMQLVEAGLLGLNRPVAEYLPEFVEEAPDAEMRARREAVMVHHLLTHTSGFRGEDVEGLAAERVGTAEVPPPPPGVHPPVHRYMFLRRGAPQWMSPGKEMAYCNLNYALLGQIAVCAGGEPLEEQAEQRLSAPLGMGDTTLGLPTKDYGRVVKRPPDAPFAAMLNSEGSWDARQPVGGVFSTARDMAIFGQMFFNGGRYGNTRILSRAAVREMTRNQIPGIGSRWKSESFPEASWGLGWNVRARKKSFKVGTLPSGSWYGHEGAGGAELWIDPENEVVCALFTVHLKEPAEGGSCADLFQNAVIAAIDD